MGDDMWECLLGVVGVVLLLTILGECSHLDDQVKLLFISWASVNGLLRFIVNCWHLQNLLTNMANGMLGFEGCIIFSSLLAISWGCIYPYV